LRVVIRYTLNVNRVLMKGRLTINE
jgi:hypothetical protein